MISVRQASSQDAQSVYAAESSYIDCPWTEEQVKQAINSERTVFLVAYDGQTFCGYVSGDITLDECEINNIAVVSNYRRRGVGLMLMTELCNRLRARSVNTVYLLVRDDNTPAQELYKKSGFAVVGKRPDYYKGKDALIMRLYL